MSKQLLGIVVMACCWGQSAVAASASSPSDGWWQSIEMSGAVELEASYTDNMDINDTGANGNTSDITVAEVALGAAAQINDWTSANVVLLWEEEDGSNELTVDEATITIGHTEQTPFYLTAGRMTVPFGLFETHMVSDPFTLDLAETKETALLAGYAANGLAGRVYAFNGEVDSGDQTVDNFGVNLSYSTEIENSAWALDFSYIHDMADVDGIIDGASLSTTADDIPGVAVNMNYRHGAVGFIGEYVVATDNFQRGEIAFNGQGAKPSAWNVEAAYSFDGIADGAIFSVAYQETDEAVALGLPESRLSAALSIDLMKNTALSFEWAHDEAYSTADGGTGQDANTAKVQLAVEF